MTQIMVVIRDTSDISMAGWKTGVQLPERLIIFSFATPSRPTIQWGRPTGVSSSRIKRMQHELTAYSQVIPMFRISNPYLHAFHTP